MGIQRILRIREVQHVTGLSRTTIYEKIANKTFPAQVKIAAHTVGWRERDIEKWMEALAPVDAEVAMLA